MIFIPAQIGHINFREDRAGYLIPKLLCFLQFLILLFPYILLFLFAFLLVQLFFQAFLPFNYIQQNRSLWAAILRTLSSCKSRHFVELCTIDNMLELVMFAVQFVVGMYRTVDTLLAYTAVLRLLVCDFLSQPSVLSSGQLITGPKKPRKFPGLCVFSSTRKDIYKYTKYIICC